jgi:hypothetical protein
MRLIYEELRGRIYRHRQHVGDRLVPDFDLERLRIIASSVARRTSKTRLQRYGWRMSLLRALSGRLRRTRHFVEPARKRVN